MSIFPLFDENVDFPMHKTAVKYLPVISTLKSDLLNLNKENVYNIIFQHPVALKYLSLMFSLPSIMQHTFYFK
jgi:hypothetical protein